MRTLTLHQAMISILRNQPDYTAHADVLSEEIYKQGLYSRKDGNKADTVQIRARAKRYEHLFELVEGNVRLVSATAGN